MTDLAIIGIATAIARAEYLFARFVQELSQVFLWRGPQKSRSMRLARPTVVLASSEADGRADRAIPLAYWALSGVLADVVIRLTRATGSRKRSSHKWFGTKRSDDAAVASYVPCPHVILSFQLVAGTECQNF